MTTYTATPIVLVNPARAGMILKERDGELRSNCKPRASGDDPISEWISTPMGP